MSNAPESTIPLGPFELTRKIAAGGMGEVWDGRHVASGTPIACKVITGQFAKDPEYIEEFTREVRAVAALDHRGIIRVHDCGVIGAATAKASAESLVGGSPYLVMERGDGTLGTLGRVLTWPELQHTLLRLLDALAHAHARGIIHRDLKPANVLLVPSLRHRRIDIRLTDFGIADARDSRDTTSGMTEESSGTPKYMAPEQLRGLWRDYGPWTDLYSVGCLAWFLACGQPPWGGDLFSLITSHINEAPPTLTPLISVPVGFEAWLRRLLRKSTHERFTCAADAAFALTHLDGVDPALLHEGPPTLVSTDDLQALTLRFSESESETMGALPAAPSPTPTEERPTAPLVVPPMPYNWARAGAHLRPPPLSGAGLGLFGLRDFPLVGRDAEREALWRALWDVRTRRRAAFVLLRGGPGSGKSSLLEWLVRRAREVGAATVLTARHRVGRPRFEGLRYAVGRHLSSRGLRGAKLEARLGQVFQERTLSDPAHRAAIATFLDPDSDVQQDVASVTALLDALLRSMGRARPVIICLDDVDRGVGALQVASEIVRHHPDTPVLFVAAARSADLEAESARDAITALRQLPTTQVHDIDALSHEAHSTFVHSMLHLDGALADTIVARTEGNPLFAVQLVSDLVARGLLELHDGHFTTRSALKLPDDIHELWLERLSRAIDLSRLWAVELAAVLGRQVDASMWRGLCTHAGVPVSATLVPRLLETGLARPTDDGWEFAHALLHESLLRSVEAAGRAARWHSACAEFLTTTSPASYGDIALHWLSAGRTREATFAMTAGARADFGRRDFGGARQVLEPITERAHGVTPHAWACAQTLLAVACTGEGEFELAAAHLTLGAGNLDPAQVHDDGLPRCVEVAAGVALGRGRPRVAKASFELARTLWAARGNHAKAERCGVALRALGA